MPNYVLAAPENLLLSDCGFEDITWTNQLHADYETYSNCRRQFEKTSIDLCLKQSMMGFFYNQFVTSSKLCSGDIHNIQKELIPKNRVFTWLEFLDLIPREHKKQKKQKEITRAIIQAKQEQ